MTHTRRGGQRALTPPEIEERTAAILAAAVAVIRTRGYLGLTRDAVAAKAGVAAGLVNRYCGTMEELRHRVMQAAVSERILSVIAQGIAHGDEVALDAPAELRAAAVASVGGDL